MPLRILHVTPYYEDAWAYGGIPRLATAMARGLAERGHDVTVCTTDVCDERTRIPAPDRRGPFGSNRSPRRSHGVTVRVFPNLSNRLAYHVQFFLPIGLGRYLGRHGADFDVAHIHAHHHVPGALAARHLTRARVPYVLAPNGTAPRLERRRLAKWLFDLTAGRHVLPGAARVLAVSEAERRQLLGLGVPAARITVLPNPMDLGEFDGLPPAGRFRARLGLPAGPLVLYLGKLTPRKRLDVLIDAFGRLERRDARLVIAGNDMGIGRAVRQQLDQLGLRGVTELTGLLVGRERLEALIDADAVVYPSRDEVFGLVPFEALLCGTPVVVADDSGCAEYVRQTGGGLIVPQGDAPALAGSIRQILAEPERWARAAREAAPRVRASFASAVVCERLERLYEELVGASTGHRSARIRASA